VDTVNNKGSFKDEGSFGKKFKNFFKEKGFYIAIVVGLCVLAAGAVYFSTNQILTVPEQPNQAREDGMEDNLDDFNGIGLDFTDKEDNIGENALLDDIGTNYADDGPYAGLDDESFDEVTDIDETTEVPTENDTDSVPQTSSLEEEAKASSGNVDASLNDNSATEDVVLAIVRPAFIAPVNGKVQAEYSMDKLVFSPTFNEWRTHSGTDIAAPRGEVVRAVGDGVILEIKNDPRYGFTVVIDHKNGYKSLYANLASDKTIQVGQEVKQGDPIGSVGATAIFESAEPTHLHFELYKENKLVNPADYIDLEK